MKENIDIINSKIMDLVKEISSLSADDKKTRVLDSYYRSALLSIVAFSDHLLTTDSLEIEDPSVIVLDHDPIQVEDPNKIVLEEASIMIDQPTDDDTTILLPVDPFEFNPNDMVFENAEDEAEFVEEANETVVEVEEAPIEVNEEADLDDAMVDLITDENTIILENDPIPYDVEDVREEMNLVAQEELIEASEDPNVILLDEDPSDDVEDSNEIELEENPTIEVETDEEEVAE